jgi:hypothetical protein
MVTQADGNTLKGLKGDAAVMLQEIEPGLFRKSVFGLMSDTG